MSRRGRGGRQLGVEVDSHVLRLVEFKGVPLYPEYTPPPPITLSTLFKSAASSRSRLLARARELPYAHRLIPPKPPIERYGDSSMSGPVSRPTLLDMKMDWEYFAEELKVLEDPNIAKKRRVHQPKASAIADLFSTAEAQEQEQVKDTPAKPADSVVIGEIDYLRDVPPEDEEEDDDMDADYIQDHYNEDYDPFEEGEGD